MKKLEVLFTAGRKIKWCNYFGKVLIVLQKKLELPYDPTIPFLDIYPREVKVHIQTKPSM
jgi:hypothetical protein